MSTLNSVLRTHGKRTLGGVSEVRTTLALRRTETTDDTFPRDTTGFYSLQSCVDITTQRRLSKQMSATKRYSYIRISSLYS